MKQSTRWAAGMVLLVLLAWLPIQFASEYWLGYGISLLQYGTLAMAWAMFSGPTRYVSLATVAFFGLGAYMATIFSDALPWPAVLAASLSIGLAVALVLGLSTLRLSGVHFVVFTFGLAELVRQLFTWYESNVVKVVGRYIFTDITQKQIYLQLLLLFVLVVAAAFFIRHSRLGLALRLIGEDEAAARHLGVDTTRAKVLLFVISAGFMTLVGAVMAPRWTYVDPSIVFNPTISFQVVIMALLGGAHRLLGPIAGVIPLTALFEFLSARFPNHFSIMLGITFLAIVFIVPRGISGWLMQLRMPHLPRWGRKGIA